MELIEATRPATESSRPTIANARNTWAERRGLLLRIEAKEFVDAPETEPLDATAVHQGVGEASPLPGYSPDTFEAVHRELGAWSGAVLDLERPTQSVAAALAEIPETLPSARFALETALLDAIARARGESLPQLLWDDDGARSVPGSRGRGVLHDPVPLAVLLDSEADDALLKAEEAVERGVRTLKIKIGKFENGRGATRGEAAETALLAALRERFGGTVDLRLDANQALDPATAAQRLAILGRFEPELIEEPVPLADLAALGDPAVPLALDESLQARSSGSASPLDGLMAVLADPAVRRPLVAIVLKPAALGGLLVCREMARRAERLGIAAIPSHLFDGPVALRAASALALSLPRGPYAAGLAPHAGLRFWPTSAAGLEDRSTIEPWSEAGLGDGWLAAPGSP